MKGVLLTFSGLIVGLASVSFADDRAGADSRAFAPAQLTLTPSTQPAANTEGDPLAEALPILWPGFDQVVATPRVPEQAQPAPTAADYSSAGIGFSSVYLASALEYRSSLGTGFGVATNESWCISHTFTLGRDLDLSIFYLHGMERAADDGIRKLGIDLGGSPLDRSYGLNLKWKF